MRPKFATGEMNQGKRGKWFKGNLKSATKLEPHRLSCQIFDRHSLQKFATLFTTALPKTLKEVESHDEKTIGPDTYRRTIMILTITMTVDFHAASLSQRQRCGPPMGGRSGAPRA